MLNKLIDGENIESHLQQALLEIHSKGPSNPLTFEKLAYAKKYHPETFNKYEKKLIAVLGLFYKLTEPSSILEEIYSIFSDSIQSETGNQFTPIQASAYREIHKNRYFSFSAPTSSGKSFLFRELIQNTDGDIIIVVPSRALISEYYYEVVSLVDKSVLVLQFIEDINKENINRRVFIITPERGRELFKYAHDFNVELLLLDEAQISEEDLRGMTFDSFVRRADSVFPNIKKVFAHPFIDNPSAQLIKHGFTEHSSSRNYNLHTVGKIFISNNNGKFEHFSPNINCDSVPLGIDIAADILNTNGSVLIYISKNKIYDGRYIEEYSNYIDLCAKIDDEKAVEIIEKLRSFIGASRKGLEKHSLLVEMMEQGIVIHHGSMPLRARLLIEEFIKLNFARLCFATSTLNQGINMPFDVVWIDNFTRMLPLTLKNLIGRSGRTTPIKNYFDYGYTIIQQRNLKTFKQRFKETISITETSNLDREIVDLDEDLRDIVEAIQDDSYDNDLQLTESQVDRIKEADIDCDIKYILDILLHDYIPITGKAYYTLSKSKRDRIKSSFKKMYVKHLRRSRLIPAESAILSAAIPILLWHVQGKSFSEIVSLRYSFLSERDKRRHIIRETKRTGGSTTEAKELIGKIPIKWTPIPAPLPNKNLRRAPLYPQGTSVTFLDYDTIVYDTYDYLDKVISLSLVDPICASLQIYYEKNNDLRAKALLNYIRFGTNDEIDIWLIKYGFGFEEIDWIKEHVEAIDASKITFKNSIIDISDDKKLVIERYL
ncbi:MAG: DEAD/DEAH box helicase [Candidatus Peregrinibacteria bacterium]|nr:DEAD/DEAH box helicase [Candidatus Peregrinibacteria bacterium]